MTKQMVLGSADWLKLQREGIFERRPPVPAEPIRSPEEIEARIFDAANRAFREADRRSHYQRRKKKRKKGGGVRSYYGDPCGYCERPMLGFRFPTRDHVHPRRLGGTLHPENVIIACSPCNHDKGGRTLEEFARWLVLRADPRAAIVTELAERRPSFSASIVAGWEAARREAQRAEGGTLT